MTGAHLYLNGIAIEQINLSRAAHCRVLIPCLPEKKYHELVISPVVSDEPGEGEALLAMENVTLGLWSYRFYQRLLREKSPPPGRAVGIQPSWGCYSQLPGYVSCHLVNLRVHDQMDLALLETR